MNERWRALSIELESLIGYDATTEVTARITARKTDAAANLESLEKVLTELR